jgi:hypothetical protein
MLTVTRSVLALVLAAAGVVRALPQATPAAPSTSFDPATFYAGIDFSACTKSIGGSQDVTYCRFGKRRDGNFFGFDCPQGAHVVSLSVRASDRIRAIQVHCSDGTSSDFFGSSEGDVINMPVLPTQNIPLLSVQSGNEIDGLEYALGHHVGGNGGKEGFAFDPKGSPLVGLQGRTSDLVSSLTFKFSWAPFGSSSPTQMFGGSGGANYNFFDCPSGSFVSQMNTRHSDSRLIAIQFVCSDGTISQSFGGNGGQFGGISLPSGLSSLQVRSGGEVDALIINGSRFGGESGELHDVSSPCGGVINGAEIQWEDRIDAIGFKFNCK